MQKFLLKSEAVEIAHINTRKAALKLSGGFECFHVLGKEAGSRALSLIQAAPEQHAKGNGKGRVSV